MKSPLLLLFSFLVLSLFSFAEEAKEEKPKRDFIVEADAFLSSDVKSKVRKKKASAWLNDVAEHKPTLGDRAYYLALAHAVLGQFDQGAAALVKQFDAGKEIPYHAAAHQKAMSRLLQLALNKSFADKKLKAIPAIVRSQLKHTNREVATIYPLLARQLKKLESEEAQLLRSELLTILANQTYLDPAKKDQLAGQLYGRRIAPSEAAPTPQPGSPRGATFDQPRFLIMGGGGSPSHNQISLEKNVQFLLRLQEGKGFSADQNHLLFADGTDEGRDLQMMDVENEPGELQELLAALLASPSGIYHTYRDNELKDVRGASTEENIKKYFDDLSITNSEQLVINFTGHGGRGEKNNALNTSMYLWEGKSFRVKDFCSALDKVPKENPVMMLMVQCFSGGFANVIFKEGNPDKGLSDHARCGFYATVHDRIAAGCTPAVDEADYREYSSYFLAALHGVDRVGRKIENPDYDGDGTVCFAEAHAYALITSDTLDISVKTSDAFLRKYSAIREGLLNTESYYQLIKEAGPCEAAVLEQLSTDLGLPGDARVSTARKVAQDLYDERKEVGDKRNELKKANTDLRNALRKSLRAQWPELFYPWHPAIDRIMNDEADKVLGLINDHPKGQAYKDNFEKMDAASDRYYALEARWAKFQRFIRTADNVAYEANLPEVASKDLQERFAALKKLEYGTLQAAESTAVTTGKKAL